MAADWNSKRVECDSNPCKGSDGAILVSVVAIDRVVGPEEARAHVELLAIKDLERERGDHIGKARKLRPSKYTETLGASL